MTAEFEAIVKKWVEEGAEDQHVLFERLGNRFMDEDLNAAIMRYYK